jgi:hypothetical protein
MQDAFQSMTKAQKQKFIACVAMIISFFLPWWSYSGGSNILGQSYSASISMNGFRMNNYIIGMGASIAAAYFIFKNLSFSLYASIACVLYGANVYFGWTGIETTSFNYNVDKVGSVSAGGGYTYGFYTYAASSLILLFFELEQAGYLKKASQNEDTVKPPTESNKQSSEESQ